MNSNEVKTNIRQGEGQTAEFKTSFSEENPAIKTLCAFANAEGGTIYFGVKNNGDIIGVDIGKIPLSS